MVVSQLTNSVLRYNDTTGAFLGAFVPAGSGGLDAPSGFTFGPDGNLYVASDTGNNIYRYNGTTGAFISVFVSPGSGGLIRPQSIGFGPDGDLYVLSYGTTQLLRYNGTTGAFVGVAVPFAPTASMAFRPDGYLYLGYWTPSEGGRVDRYNSSTFAFAGTFASVPGGEPVANFTFSSSGDLIAASYVGDSVLRVPASGGIFSTLVPSGSGGLVGASDVALGADHNLYVAGYNSNDVLRFDGTTGAFIDAFVPAGSGDLAGTQALLFHSFPSYATQVQQPINSDGSSVFNYRRGVLPVKFTLSLNGSPTCTLPPATIAVYRTSGASPGLINESDYVGSADSGSSFRISECQYIYNLNTRSFGPGTFRVTISINSTEVGNATFGFN